MPQRSPEEVQREIEQARDALAVAVDQLAYRADPKRVVAQAKLGLRERAQSPAGQAVIAGTGLLAVLLIVRRFRR